MRATFQAGTVFVTALLGTQSHVIERLLLDTRGTRMLLVVPDDMWGETEPTEADAIVLGTTLGLLRAARELALDLIAAAEAVAVVSEPLLALARRSNSNVHLVPWAAPLRNEWPAARPHLTRGRRVGWVGMPFCRTEADFAFLHDAFGRLAAARPDVSFLL